ncbi:MAG: hypothetical protein ABIP20_16125 [Chthoniobacteraceae bacterium]
MDTRVILDHDDVSITVDHPARSADVNLTHVWKHDSLNFLPADSTDLANLLDEALSRAGHHGIYLRPLAAAEPLL